MSYQLKSFLALMEHGVVEWDILEQNFTKRVCLKVCQSLAAGLWFSPDTLVSSINKTDHHDITEILLKVVLKTILVTL
jgi:hypothetical protein